MIWSAYTSNFLKAVFHKFHLVHSWILWPKYNFNSSDVKKIVLFLLSLILASEMISVSCYYDYLFLVAFLDNAHRTEHDVFTQGVQPLCFIWCVWPIKISRWYIVLTPIVLISCGMMTSVTAWWTNVAMILVWFLGLEKILISTFLVWNNCFTFSCHYVDYLEVFLCDSV